LTNSTSAQYPKLIAALFNPDRRAYAGTDSRLDDYTYDNAHDDDLQVWLTVISQRLTQLFQRHGAVETHLPLLIPDTTLLSVFPSTYKPAKLLDPTGKLVRLPTHNLLAMARNVTRRQIERIKRYHVGARYNARFEGQPSAYSEMTFDIISPLRSTAAEAEVLDVVDKVLAEFKGARSPAFADYELHVSHEGVLATIMGAVPDRARLELTKLFRDAGAHWPGDAQHRAKLASMGIPKPLVDELDSCFVADEFGVVRAKLQAVFTSNVSRRRLAPALEELESVVRLAHAAGVERRIIFRPTLARHAEMFRGGFLFEVVRRGKATREVLAWGGRFDSLLEHFKDPATAGMSASAASTSTATSPLASTPGALSLGPPSALASTGRRTPQVHGVGFCIATDLLARTVRKYESALSARLMNKDVEAERSFGFWTPARCDVYVVASGLDLAGRMGITGELWRAGVRCDLQYDDGRSLIEVERECLDQNTL
jgi:translation initiation factor 2-alpha kinase 4